MSKIPDIDPAVLERGVTVDDVSKLRHMLGMRSHIARRSWGYRNHYAPGPDDVSAMERLVSAGLVARGRPYQGAHFYHATEAGCRAAGLSKAATRRALEG